MKNTILKERENNLKRKVALINQFKKEAKGQNVMFKDWLSLNNFEFNSSFEGDVGYYIPSGVFNVENQQQDIAEAFSNASGDDSNGSKIVFDKTLGYMRPIGTAYVGSQQN